VGVCGCVAGCAGGGGGGKSYTLDLNQVALSPNTPVPLVSPP